MDGSRQEVEHACVFDYSEEFGVMGTKNINVRILERILLPLFPSSRFEIQSLYASSDGYSSSERQILKCQSYSPNQKKNYHLLAQSFSSVKVTSPPDFFFK